MANRGFTLLETMIAMFLLLVLLLAAAPLFVYATRGSSSAADLSWVGAAAVERMELIRRLPYHNLTAGGSLTSNASGYSDVSDPEVTVRWRVVDIGSPAARKQISVVASANRQIVGARKSALLITLRAR